MSECIVHCKLFGKDAIERQVLGIKPLVPLVDFRRSLGPGYKAGWYAKKGLGGRIENCNVMDYNASYVNKIERKYAEVQKEMKKSKTIEDVGRLLERGYHARGHNYISMACSSIYDPVAKKGWGVMAYSEVSARDPIFYRWHTHIEDVMVSY